MSTAASVVVGVGLVVVGCVMVVFNRALAIRGQRSWQWYSRNRTAYVGLGFGFVVGGIYLLAGGR